MRRSERAIKKQRTEIANARLVSPGEKSAGIKIKRRKIQSAALRDVIEAALTTPIPLVEEDVCDLYLVFDK